jgi:hypothetical protein
MSGFNWRRSRTPSGPQKLHTGRRRSLGASRHLLQAPNVSPALPAPLYRATNFTVAQLVKNKASGPFLPGTKFNFSRFCFARASDFKSTLTSFLSKRCIEVPSNSFAINTLPKKGGGEGALPIWYRN